LIEDLCRQIESARVDLGLSYTKLGSALGLSGQYIGRICTGRG
jgi:hypothetical protein